MANDCTLNGKPKYTEGKFGKAMDFDAVDDTADCGDKDNLDVGVENFSVAAWIKCAKYDPGEWQAEIVFKFELAAPRHGYLLAVRGSLDASNKNKPVFIFGLGDAAGIHMFGTKVINDGIWHHLAVTVDRNNSMIMYRDGEIEAQTNIAGFVKQNENNAKEFCIGSEKGTPGRYFKGAIDEVALFKAILSQDEIKTLMNFGLGRALGLEAVNSFGKATVTWASVKAEY
jgi:sialidase-1